MLVLNCEDLTALWLHFAAYKCWSSTVFSMETAASLKSFSCVELCYHPAHSPIWALHVGGTFSSHAIPHRYLSLLSHWEAVF